MVTWFVRALNAALLILAAVVCAHWFWMFAAPSVSAPPPSPVADTLRPAETLRRANLFGAASNSPQTPAARADLVLRGIYANRDGGMAVIALDRARTVTVRSGEELAPGITLERVLRDHVIVNQGGVSQRLELPQAKPLDAPPTAPPAHAAKK